MRRPLGYRQRVQRGAVRWVLVMNLLIALEALLASVLLLRRVWP